MPSYLGTCPRHEGLHLEKIHCRGWHPEGPTRQQLFDGLKHLRDGIEQQPHALAAGSLLAQIDAILSSNTLKAE